MDPYSTWRLEELGYDLLAVVARCWRWGTSKLTIVEPILVFGITVHYRSFPEHLIMVYAARATTQIFVLLYCLSKLCYVRVHQTSIFIICDLWPFVMLDIAQNKFDPSVKTEIKNGNKRDLRFIFINKSYRKKKLHSFQKFWSMFLLWSFLKFLIMLMKLDLKRWSSLNMVL